MCPAFSEPHLFQAQEKPTGSYLGVDVGAPVAEAGRAAPASCMPPQGTFFELRNQGLDIGVKLAGFLEPELFGWRRVRLSLPVPLDAQPCLRHQPSSRPCTCCKQEAQWASMRSHGGCPLPALQDQATQSLHLSHQPGVKYKHVWNGYSPFYRAKRLRVPRKPVFSRPGDKREARIGGQAVLSPSSMPPSLGGLPFKGHTPTLPPSWYSPSPGLGPQLPGGNPAAGEGARSPPV